MVYYEIHTKGFIFNESTGAMITVGKSANNCDTKEIPIEQLKVGDWVECEEYEQLEKVKRIVSTLDFKEWERA